MRTWLWYHRFCSLHRLFLNLAPIVSVRHAGWDCELNAQNVNVISCKSACIMCMELKVTKESLGSVFNLLGLIICVTWSVNTFCLSPSFLSLCSVWSVVSTCALSKQWTHRGLVSGHHEHRGLRWGEISVPHHHLSLWKLWRRDVTHRVEWVPWNGQIHKIKWA